MTNGHDREHGAIEATLGKIKEGQDRIENTLNDFIDGTAIVRIECHERISRLENTHSYLDKTNKNRIATWTVIIAFISAAAACYVAFIH